MPQAVLVVTLMAMWAALAASRAEASMSRARFLTEGIQVRLAVGIGLEEVFRPPDLQTLCLAAPSMTFRKRWSIERGATIEVRWRRFGVGLILAEVDAAGPAGGRRRAVAWLAPDSTERRDGREHCLGDRLRPLGAGAIFLRPGE